MELISTHIVRKSDIGVHDNLFGGELMSWIDLAGAAFSMQICNTEKMVTKKLSEIIFHSPVKVNSLVKLYGLVVKVGNTSITCEITVTRVDVISKTEVNVCKAQIVFVRVDEYGIPRLIDETVRLKYNPKPKKIESIDDISETLIYLTPEEQYNIDHPSIVEIIDQHIIKDATKDCE